MRHHFDSKSFLNLYTKIYRFIHQNVQNKILRINNGVSGHFQPNCDLEKNDPFFL